jgi:hypothetical protein
MTRSSTTATIRRFQRSGRQSASAAHTSENFWKTYVDSGGPLPADRFDLLFGFARLGAFIDLMWTDHHGRANPTSLPIIRSVAAAIEHRVEPSCAISGSRKIRYPTTRSNYRPNSAEHTAAKYPDELIGGSLSP